MSELKYRKGGLSLDEKDKLVLIERERRRRASQEKDSHYRKEVQDYLAEGIADAGVSFMQSSAMEYGDDAYGYLMGAYKKSTGDPRTFKEIQKEYQTEALGMVEGRRARSKFMGFLGEVVAPNPAKLLKGLAGLRHLSGPVGSSAIQSYGHSNSDDPKRVMKEVAIGAGMGGVAKGLGYIGGKVFGEPVGIESRHMGFDASKAKGYATDLKDKMNDSALYLREKGAFNKKATDWNSKEGRWTFTGKKQIKESASMAMERKFINGLENSSKENIKILSNKSKFSVDEEGLPLGDSMSFHVGDYNRLKLGDGTVQSRIKQIEAEVLKMDVTEVNAVKKAIEKSQKNLTGGLDFGEFDLINLQEEKLRLYKTLTGKWGEETTAVGVEVNKRLARMYKDMINEYSRNPKIIENNKTMEHIYNYLEGTTAKAKKVFSSSPSKEVPMGGGPFGLSRMFEAGIDPSRPIRSAISRKYEKLPSYQKEYLEGAASLAPQRIMSREPQSIPEQLIRKKFPRSTKAIIDNKDMVLAKLAQQAPEMFDMVNEVIENRSEDIPDIMPLLTKIAAPLFEKDKYNRFDGVISDPMLVEVARKDTMKNDSLSNTQRIEILNKLNKTGEYPL